ncbi:DNA recombination protein RmuC [Modicisalibacter coralii]|uniref:DNA recombination protein RmuC n=1 Tax=Modicisalibacter coralii TaxID=2304602 RepID=UPI00100B496D|nr:DNA recombination protein RmuC [Halomonas coralii]
MILDPIPLAVAAALTAFIAGWSLAAWRGARRVAALRAIQTDLESRLAEQARQAEAAQAALSQADIARARVETELAGLRRHQDELRAGFEERLRERDTERQRLEARLAEQAAVLEEAQERTAGLRETLQSATTQRDETRRSLADHRQWWEAEKSRSGELAGELAELKTAYGELATTLEQKQTHFDEQLDLLRQSREALKQEFENLANEILERKGKAFSALSQERISGLLQPIHNEMKGFREKVESIHQQESEQRVQLRTELRHLQELNRAITDQADRLTNALQGQKKIQGNWGELMLENVLDGAGLRRGVDYQREASFTTEEGRKRPDAIVHLPQGKHLVIDAKTSLAAYTRYVNADDDTERRQALAEHCRAVRERINELADRHYYDLPGLNSPEVVIMFVPVESAYVEALKFDDGLYQRAIENNVLVATPTTLLTSLNIVRQLWRFEDQNKHTAELANRAERFYAKLATFLNSMEDVGKKLDGARVSYDRAMNQLVSGKGNLIKQTAEFKDLGVAVKKELPAELVERAHLELDRHGAAGTSDAPSGDPANPAVSRSDV